MHPVAFGENLIISAHPSKSGGDWWYGTLVSNGKRGFFPAGYVAVIDQGREILYLFFSYSKFLCVAYQSCVPKPCTHIRVPARKNFLSMKGTFLTS